MAQELSDYGIGARGVQLVPSPLHTPDGGILVGQNVEFIRNQGMGGLGTRGGLAPLNSSVLAGSVRTVGNIPLTFPSEFDLMLGLNAGETNTWDKSVDGVIYTGLPSATLLRPAGIDKLPSGLGGSAISTGQRAASYKNRFYYPGDAYVVDTDQPPFIVFNGTTSWEQFRLPNNPTSAGPCKWIADTWIANGIIYLCCWDPGGSAPNHKGRVLVYDPSNGILEELGNRFGNGSGENTKGFPFCVTTYLGKVWVGTYGISGNNQGGVYTLQPGVDTSWTLDLTATLHNGYFMSLCAFNGKLYAATDADSSGTAIIQQRTSLGVWSTSLTAPAANSNYFAGLIVFGTTPALYAVYYKGAGTPSILIKKYDGTSWTTDLDVATTYSLTVSNFCPGMPFIFRGKLYWPFIGGTTSPTATTGFLLERTDGGVWTRRVNNVGVRGVVGQFVPGL